MPNLDAQLAAVQLAWSLDPNSTPELTDEQRTLLSSFMGWGQFAPVFAPDADGKNAETSDALEEAMPADAYFSASTQVDTSFFTPAAVTNAVYDIVRSVGFTGGRAFEPGCGAGAFMSAAPSDMSIDWTGIDIDPTATRIARLLHPAAEIITGRLERTPLRDGTFDVAVGNVPFSSVAVRDNEGRHASLHNYFILRAAEAVRPGGYVVLVTSRHTMDSAQSLIREGATKFPGMTFQGALRLPSGAFAEAGTEVVTDVIILRRNEIGAEHRFYTGTPESSTDYSHRGWNGYRTTDNGLWVSESAQGQPGIRTRVSAYWADNPAHVAGRMAVTTYSRSPLVVLSDDLHADLVRALAHLTDKLAPIGAYVDTADVSDVVLFDAEGRKEGSFHVIGGQMHKVQNGVLVETRNNKELTSLVRLRDLMLHLLALEADTSLPDAVLDEPRALARAAYEQYVNKFGPLNRGTLVEGKIDEETGLPAYSWRRPAMGGFRRDPDSALVMALEVFDQNTGSAGPADILTVRVTRAPEPIERVDTPQEALAVSLGESAKVDLDRIAGLLGLDDATLARAALDGLVFDDPSTGRVVPAAEYLSGNVRQKLRVAESLGLEANADALRSVLPADLGPLEITLNLGHPLVSVKEIEQFINTGLNAGGVTVSHEHVSGTWEVNGGDWCGADARIKWGTGRMTPARLVELALNGRTPEVTDEVYDASRGAYRRVRNLEDSAAAAEKQALIRDFFSTWVWEDKDRSERLCREYNELYNSHVTRTFTGEGIVFPGMSEHFTPWTHQRSAVERIVSTPATLIGHPVGAGKSATMALSAVTLRKFGLANKPLIVVPNHLLEQMAREAQQVVPTAKLLVATKEDLSRDNRRMFAARCATGDWDAVIMTHSAFTLIPVHPKTEEEWVGEEKFRLSSAIAEATGNGSKGAKALARWKRSFDQRIDKLRDRMGDQDALYFDQLGVDYIMVDEAHLFRRQDTNSSQRGNGFGTGSSKRATDLLLKIETLRAKKGDRAPVVAMFTGTPWSNTLAETWVWQRYLQPEVLDAMSLRHFDAWVSVFVNFETAIEVAPDGSGFRSYRRPVGLVNVPELKTMLAQVADIIDPNSLQTERPDVLQHLVAVEGTDEQMAFVKDLAERADELRSGTPRERGTGEDNMLVIVGDGRKVALDPRLVGIDEESPKMRSFADRAAGIYHANADRHFGEHPKPGAFQLVFCDLGTPRPDDSQTYGRARKMLVDRGVPANMIRFAHEATTDKARAALFAACRDGDVAVLFGSTPKVGMGTNVQNRLSDLHHLDAPWLPAEYIQRNGRGDRHGNKSGLLNVHRYVAEGTFDAYMWQALERKSRSFDALYATGSSAREIEDVSAATLSYGEVKAVASGNPLLLEQAKMRAVVKRLRLLRAVHMQGVTAAREGAKRAAQQAAGYRRQAEKMEQAAVQHARTGATAADRELLTAKVEKWLKWKASYERFNFGALNVTVDTNGYGENERVVGFDVRWDYKSLTDIPMDRRTLRRKPAAIADIIADKLESFAAGLDARAADLRQRAAVMDEQEATMTAAAESNVFEQEDELAEAVARLAEIDLAIVERANADQKVPA